MLRRGTSGQTPGPTQPTTDPHRAPKLTRRPDGRLWLSLPERDVRVRPVRCFPWTAPDEHISLRDDRERERAYITSMSELDASSRRALEQTLAQTGLVLHITAVLEIEEDFEMRRWKVQTRGGLRMFQTKLDAWPRRVPGGGLVIEDVAGDLYWFPEPRTLDPASRKLLWAYTD